MTMRALLELSTIFLSLRSENFLPHRFPHSGDSMSIERLFQRSWLRTPLLRSTIAFFLSVSSALLAGEFELTVAPQQLKYELIDGVEQSSECFSIDVSIDPVVNQVGDTQIVCSLVIGAQNADADRFEAALTLDLREGNGSATHVLWHRDLNLTMQMPSPKPAGWVDNREYQHPNRHLARPGGGHHFRVVVLPYEAGSRVRLFVDAMDRPIEQHDLKKRITAGMVKLFSMRGGSPKEPARTSRFSEFGFQQLKPEEAMRLPSHAEIVLAALDLTYLPLAAVADAIEAGNQERAEELLLKHMRERTTPPGPKLDTIASSIIHPDYRKISDALLAGQFATLGYFDGFVDAWTDTNGDTHQWVLQKEPLQLNWSKDNGFLNRHFHWVSLAKTWTETNDGRYAKRFSDEVTDWVSREPFFWDRTPTIGGLNIMDGTRFRWGYMNTSNIGRRLELTWWPAYEVFRRADEFHREAHFAMLVGMIRQAELITNPSSFAVHDDGAAHTTLALLQTALLLPEFKESSRWKEVALARWDEMLAKQFHPDGSHVSLSLGYNWATIMTLENFIRLMEQLGQPTPHKYTSLLEKALEHPMLMSTPNQSMIPLNDAGWGLVDDHFKRSVQWFPDRQEFQWMATRGQKGAPPEQRSVYFPNAGHYAMRTGWGQHDKYLFFGAGPWGASHGKQDALTIFTQFGTQPLIRDAGRGDYSAIGHTVHAGRSLSYNTLSPDWAQENSIPHWRHEMHVGFHPPNRRWISNQFFDYGEGKFDYGWYRPDEHIRGNWIRQVVFVKGPAGADQGYYVVIDTVEPAEDTMRTWRHPWQLNPDDIEIRSEDLSIVAKNRLAALQILPVDPTGDLEANLIQGQITPELLGWRIYGKTAKEWPVPTYSWQANKTFSRAWVIQMQKSETDWPVESIVDVKSVRSGELVFTVELKDGRQDKFFRREPIEGAIDFNVVSKDAGGAVMATLELTDGIDSVCRSNKQ